MKKLIFLLCITAACANCNNNTAKKETPGEAKTDIAIKTASSLQTGCYSYFDSSNAVNFEIIGQGESITGILTYALDGKDANTGTFKGELSGDKLSGTYTFLSEGVESTREVAFLVKNNQLIEGYGELNESGNAFKDKNAISYSSVMPLVQTDCNQSKAACLYVNGKSYSRLKQTCLELTTLKVKLNPLKDGAVTNGKPAFVLFDSTQSKAELFLPGVNEGMVLNKTAEGNWGNGDYKLIAWKGYVVQFKKKAVFGGG